MLKKQYSVKLDGTKMSVNEIIDAILTNRCIDDIDGFLIPRKDDMLPFEDFKNIRRAYQMLDEAITFAQPIIVFADTDTDGCTAGAIMYRYLKAMKYPNVTCEINSGKTHGVSQLQVPNSGGLIIVVDSINEMSEYQPLIDKGWNIICLDHHIPPESVMNYKGNNFVLVSSAVDYPNPELSGAGVTLKFCLYCDFQNLTDYAEYLYDLAACGIVADMCSTMSLENRYIISNGLNHCLNPGVKKLVGSYEFNTTAIAYSIAPIINASIRMNNSGYALRIFLEDDEESIDECIKIGKAQKEAQNELLATLSSDVETQIKAQEHQKVLFVSIPIDMRNLSGVLANSIVGTYQKPTIVYCNDNVITGSMRAVGVDNFNQMVNDTNLAICRGHELSAGFECEPQNFDAFQTVINEAMANVELSQNIVCDVALTPNQITDALIRQIKILNRVSGKDYNPVKIMVVTNDITISQMSKGKHLKVIDNKTGVIFVKWNDGSYQQWIDGGYTKFAGIGVPDVAYYGRTKYKQIILDEYNFKK